MTREDYLNIDFGLNVTFDGSKYRLIMQQSDSEYQIGGLICEYMRLTPMDIKAVILSCDGLEKEGTIDNFYDTFRQFHETVNIEFPPIISSMIALEFLNAAEDWFKCVREDRVEEYLGMFDESYKSVRDYIFEDTGCNQLGGDTVLQIMLTAYCSFADKYVLTKSIFNKIMANEEAEGQNNKAVDVFIAMFGERMDIQHIDYRLVLAEGKFESLYTIKSSFSLLAFDMAHAINTDARIVKCKNCGHYFVPEGRSDAVYCSYPLRDNKDKTCRDVGAKKTRANKEKNDTATKEYRRVYMRYKMNMTRHPEDKEAAEKFEKLTKDVQEWRNKLVHGIATTDEFVEWLKQF